LSAPSEPRAPAPVHRAEVGKLRVEVYATRAALGAVAAAACSRRIAEVVARLWHCRAIFAAAPSQNELLAALRADPSIRWDALEAFHMDEYHGLPQGAPQRFSQFLKNALFDHVPLREVHLMDTAGLAIGLEMRRYAALLAAEAIDVVCLGIGENGHIAFNDPPVADFRDRCLIKEVALDETCRRQQVHDGAFPELAAVPERAITLTVPALMRGEALFCVAPGPRKAQAVHDMLIGPIATSCPASILRKHPNCTLYLDAESAAAWLEAAA
jgi:glucosamine-6-phosphate deaminase